jgi:hypothetical protein
MDSTTIPCEDPFTSHFLRHPWTPRDQTRPFHIEIDRTATRSTAELNPYPILTRVRSASTVTRLQRGPVPNAPRIQRDHR